MSRQIGQRSGFGACGGRRHGLFPMPEHLVGRFVSAHMGKQSRASAVPYEVAISEPHTALDGGSFL